jgi:hypothetical protein
MTTIAALLLFATGILAQDGTPSESALTDSELGLLGGFAADQIDATPEPAALERSILEKIDEIRKARSSPEKKDQSPAPKRKAGKNAEKKEKKQKKNDPPDAIKNGLTESDRATLGRFTVSEIASDHKGEAFSADLKKELERLRAERVKASSGASEPKKKKKKAEN